MVGNVERRLESYSRGPGLQVNKNNVKFLDCYRPIDALTFVFDPYYVLPSEFYENHLDVFESNDLLGKWPTAVIFSRWMSHYFALKSCEVGYVKCFGRLFVCVPQLREYLDKILPSITEN